MERRGRNRRLNINDRVFRILMKSLDLETKLDQFKHNLGLGIVFHPNLSSYNLGFHFLNHNLSEFQFQFRFFASLFFKNFSHVHLMISPQNQIKIK